MTTAEVMDALRAVMKVDLGDRQDFRLALRSIMVSKPDEMEQFEQLFDLFWGQQMVEESDEEGADEEGPASAEETRETAMAAATEEEAEEGESDEQEVEAALYSPVEVLSGRDFSTFSAEEMEAIARAIVQIARKLATRYSRRLRTSRKSPRIDLRRTVRRNLKYGGTIVELARKRRKIRKPRLVLVCDVSRSMDQYSRFLLQFIYAFQHALGRVESFVFSTQLTRVTDYFKAHDIHEALDRISREVPEWSGGTRIGQSLKIFNERYAPTLVDSRTIVLFLSDGLDTGDVDLLDDQMSVLRRRARKVIWLNPLLGSPEYRPLARGMSTALPYIDVFAPAHNLATLEELGRHLSL